MRGRILFSSLVTCHSSLCSVQRRIVRRSGEHLVPRTKTAHDLKPKLRQPGGRESSASRFLEDPGFLLHLGLELAGTPAGITDERPDRSGIFVDELMGFVDPDVMIQLQA